MTKITRPGLYPDISPDDYYRDPCPLPSLTPSLIKTLLDFSPLHARYEHPRLETPEEDEEAEKYNKAQAIGNAAHALLIGRGRDLAVGDFDAWTTKEAKAFKADAMAAGKLPIIAKHMARAYRMEKAAREQLHHHEASDAFTAGKGEVTLAWAEGLIWFRTLIDWLHDDLLIVDDLKTGGVSAAESAIPNRMVEAGWDIRAAFIRRGLDHLFPDGAGRRRFRFIALENFPPFALTVNELPESVMTIGEKKIDHAISVWSECMSTDRWPAYGDFINRPFYPPWKETQWLDRETAFHENLQALRRDPVPSDILAGG